MLATILDEDKDMSLNEQVLAAVQGAVKLNDYGQRSAIGMARSYLDTQKFKEANSLDLKVGRDALASELVSLMEGHSEEDCIAALQEARAWVNAPFVDEAMLGFQAGRVGLMKPGEKKKAKAETK